jgi:hypothetical protein
MPTQEQRENTYYYGGQRITRERGKFWIYCLAQPFSTLRAAQKWIDRNICPECLKAAHTGDCSA